MSCPLNYNPATGYSQSCREKYCDWWITLPKKNPEDPRETTRQCCAVLYIAEALTKILAAVLEKALLGG